MKKISGNQRLEISVISVPLKKIVSLTNWNFIWFLGFSMNLGAVGDFIYVFLIFKVGLIVLNDDVKVKKPNEYKTIIKGVL